MTFALLLLSNDLTKVIVSMTNVILVLSPLIGVLFGTMYYYSSYEFIELLLAQPLSRKSVFTGMFTGLAVALILSVVLGVSIPMIMFGVFGSSQFLTFLVLILMASVLTLIFSLLAFVLSLRNVDKIKGFGLAIFCWLFFAVIYDGIFLLLLLIFREYPLENLSIFLVFLNPIDLARILILMKLDISAMMGYTGAVLQKFLGSQMGAVAILVSLFLWMWLPYTLMKRIAGRKDF
jgi:Cu-processing system permease protein